MLKQNKKTLVVQFLKVMKADRQTGAEGEKINNKKYKKTNLVFYFIFHDWHWPRLCYKENTKNTRTHILNNMD